jgi:hypothetical protein
VPTLLTYGLCQPIRWLRIEESRMDTVRIFARTDFRPTSPVGDPRSLSYRRVFEVRAPASSDKSDFANSRPATRSHRQDAYATLRSPRSHVADAQSTISFQPVFTVRLHALQAEGLSLLMFRCAPGPQLLVHSYQIRQRAGLHLVHNLTPLNFNGDLGGT